MNRKIARILYELSKNSRISTTGLSKKARISQQSASYIVNKLKKEKLISNSNAIIDSVQLGMINVLVGMNFTDIKKHDEIIQHLKANKCIVSIEESSYGVDLAIEYCMSNLSAFNKIHLDLLHRFHKSIETSFMLPVSVKHLYHRNYLINAASDDDMVIYGDREIIAFTPKERLFLEHISKTADASLTSLSRSMKIPLQTLVSMKKKLEKMRIIRGYSCVLDYDKLKISRTIVLLRLSGLGVGEIDKISAYARMHMNVVEFVKTIGKYQIMLVYEDFDSRNYVKELRLKFSIDDYMYMKIERIIKRRYYPV